MAVDYHNKEIKKGDIVRCIARHYTTKYPARLYEVLQAGEGDLITLENSFSPTGTAHYNSYNFVIHKKAPKMTSSVYHMAILLPAALDDMDLKESIENKNDTLTMMCETSPHVLKNRVTERIRQFPNERWMIMNSNSIAEIDSPPVRFRNI